MLSDVTDCRSSSLIYRTLDSRMVDCAASKHGNDDDRTEGGFVRCLAHEN